MLEFAEQEVVIPDGPFAGRKFTATRQPYAGLLLRELDRGKWRIVNVTGPTQSGKTLSGSLVPLLYHLFEVRENVIFGVPHLDMMRDKWLADIMPIISCSRYRDLLPSRGGGSRGGRSSLIRFRNGTALRFMTGGGGEKTIAGYTARVVIVTETDGLDDRAEGSREADRLSQLRARTRAFGARARIYQECTVTTEQGRTWHDYTTGSASRIACRCPHCRGWVTPEREHLRGWKDAPTIERARAESHWTCPACGQRLDEPERVEMNRSAVLAHRGQVVGDDGVVCGPEPDTDTLGFRWNAFNNLFVSAGDVGAAEWEAAHAADAENAERDLRQYWHAIPQEPPQKGLADISFVTVMARTAQPGRGVIPSGMEYAALGVDMGKRLLHWVLVAATADCSRVHVADYGRVEAASDDLGEERALMAALRELRDVVSLGWPIEGGDAKMTPTYVFVDSAWRPDVLRVFLAETGHPWYASRGYASTIAARTFSRTRQAARDVAWSGDGVQARWLADEQRHVVEVNADMWKAWLHERLRVPVGQHGAMTLFAVRRKEEHMAVARHFTAERQVEEWVAGRGTVTRWEVLHASNHFLDAAYLACAGLHMAGARLLAAPTGPTVATQPVAEPKRTEVFIPSPWTDDGRPYFVLER